MHYNLYTIPASPPHSQSAEPQCLYVLSWVQIYLINSQCRTAWSVLSGEGCGHLWLGFLYLIPHSANSNTKQRITCCFASDTSDRGNLTRFFFFFFITATAALVHFKECLALIILSLCQALSDKLIADLASLLSALVSSSLGYESYMIHANIEIYSQQNRISNKNIRSNYYYY